ncbi:MAG: radical SAM protein [Spirochaetales bacterium]|nr:radical SAM protein [Spirochaetales bacterium]
MKVLLIFPPFVYQCIREPYISLPLLAGYLKNRRIETDQRDINVEFYHHYLTRKRLEQIKRHFEEMIYNGNYGNNEEYTRLVKTKMELTWFISNLDWAKKAREHSVRLMHLLKVYDEWFERIPSLDEFHRLHSIVAGKRNPYIGIYSDYFLDEILKNRYGVIGFSIAMGAQIVPALTLAWLINESFPDIHITLGGAALNLADQSILQHLGELPYIHSIIRFGGGKSLYHLCEAKRLRKGFYGMPNIIDCTGTSPVFPDEYSPPEIDEETGYVFERRNLAFYPEGYYLPILYSQGCYWGRCSYCSNVEQIQHRFRLKNMSVFVDEMEMLYKTQHQRKFALIGECLPPLYAEALADEISRRGLAIKFWAYTRVDKNFNTEIIYKLKKAGLHKTTIGLESTQDRVLRLMKKGYNAELAFKQIATMYEAGIKMKINIIWDFPSTTKEEALNVFRWLQDNHQKFSDLAVFNFSLEKNSHMGRHPETYNLRILNKTTDEVERISNRISMKRFYNELNYEDVKGMSSREKNGIEIFYQRLSADVYIREAVKKLNFDIRCPDAGKPENWNYIREFINKFFLWEKMGESAHGNSLSAGRRFYCYNFLFDSIKTIDEEKYFYLDNFIKTSSTEELFIKLNNSKNEDRPTVERKMKYLFRLILEMR